MKNKFQIILWFCIIFFVIFFSYLSIKRYRTLNSYYYDLGIMNQVVYNTSQGRFLEMTNQELIKNTNRLAIHFDPILALFAPFYKIYSGPEVLLIGQSIILGLGALAVFLISKQVLNKNLISLVFSLLYLLSFPVQRVSLFDFHAVTLSTTFFLFALYFNLVNKNKFYFLFIFLALLTKENVGLVVIFLGLYLIFVKKQKRLGVITSLTGLIFFVSTVYFIIPYFRGNEHFALKYFVDIKLRLKTIIVDGFSYTKLLILPNFYSLFSPLTLLISLPEWAINILSINPNMRSILFHYNSIIVSFLFYSLILGYRNFNRLIKSKLIKNLILIIFIILNLRSIYLYNPIPYFVKRPVNYQNLNQITEKSVKIWQEKLKNENIKVSTTPKLAPFFTTRKYYYNFLYDSAFSEIGLTEKDILKKEMNKYVLADYVIINKLEIGDVNKETLPTKFYQHLRKNNNFRMIFSDNQEIEVYKKI